jgi:hypothetical protein
MIAQLVYVLCGLTSIACAVLLLKAYRRSRTPLLLWTGLCFGLLALSNIVLIVDLVLTGPQIDLSLYRNSLTAAAHLVLLLGLISRKD